MHIYRRHESRPMVRPAIPCMIAISSCTALFDLVVSRRVRLKLSSALQASIRALGRGSHDAHAAARVGREIHQDTQLLRLILKS